MKELELAQQIVDWWYSPQAFVVRDKPEFVTNAEKMVAEAPSTVQNWDITLGNDGRWFCFDGIGTGVWFDSKSTAESFAKFFGDAREARREPEFIDQILKDRYVYDSDRDFFYLKDTNVASSS